MLVVCQSDKRNLDALATMFGGQVRHTRSTQKGTAMWQWSLHGQRLVPVLDLLIPHLRGKQDQAKALLAYCRTIKRRGRRSLTPLQVVQRKSIIRSYDEARQKVTA
jgi:hypothetical protein